VNNLIGYFDLYSRYRNEAARAFEGTGSRFGSPVWIALQFLALVLGIIAKLFIDTVNKDSTPSVSWIRFIVTGIIALSIFPAVYKKTLDASEPGFVHLCVIFTSGLGYETLTTIRA
jgi:hypothetical protein